MWANVAVIFAVLAVATAELDSKLIAQLRNKHTAMKTAKPSHRKITAEQIKAQTSLARATVLRRLHIAWLGLRNRLIADPAFQRRAASLPFVRGIAARRARALFDICAGFVYSQVLLACVRLSLFEKLAAGPVDPTTLAPALNMPPEATDRLLRAAASLHL
eukprot:gene24098-25773_t